MPDLAGLSGIATHPGFSHEALFYGGLEDFVRQTSGFIRGGLEADEPVFVVVAGPKIDALRQALGADHAQVRWADMAEVGANPARIIPAWREFVDACVQPGWPARGIGEPISAERSPDEMVECQRHESLLNLAFSGGPAWRLQCPYDVDALDDPVIDEARRSHPTLVSEGNEVASDRCRSLAEVAAPFEAPMPAPPPGALSLAFRDQDLAAVRRFVFSAARGILGDRTDDLVLAVNELATNSIRYGGGGGLVRLWHDHSVVCEVEDAGFISDPLAGRVLPGPGREGGRGLWLVNQLCDLVQVRSQRGGTRVRVHTRLPLDDLSATG